MDHLGPSRDVDILHAVEHLLRADAQEIGHGDGGQRIFHREAAGGTEVTGTDHPVLPVHPVVEVKADPHEAVIPGGDFILRGILGLFAAAIEDLPARDRG